MALIQSFSNMHCTRHGLARVLRQPEGRLHPDYVSCSRRVPSLLRECHGMTLVEIMVALVIFGILIAMGLPAFRQYFATHAVDGSANLLSVNLRLARQKAATEQNNYKVSFDPSTNSYTILDDDNSNNVADAGEMVQGPISIPAELTVTNGPLAPFPGDSLVFYPNGTASATGTVTISNTKGFWRLVAVVRPTGAVAIR